EYTLRTTDGSRRVLVTRSPYRDRRGEVVGLVGVGRDLSRGRGAGILSRAAVDPEDVAERSRTEESLVRYAGRLEYLREIDQAILAMRSPSEIAQAALLQLKRVVPNWCSGILLFDPDTQEAVVFAAVGQAEAKFPPGTRIRPEASWARGLEALRRGETIVEPDFRAGPPSATSGSQLAVEGVRSYARVPLMDEGRP